MTFFIFFNFVSLAYGWTTVVVDVQNVRLMCICASMLSQCQNMKIIVTCDVVAVCDIHDEKAILHQMLGICGRKTITDVWLGEKESVVVELQMIGYLR